MLVNGVETSTEAEVLDDDLFNAGFDEIASPPADTSTEGKPKDEPAAPAAAEPAAPAAAEPATPPAAAEPAAPAAAEPAVPVDVAAVVAATLAALKPAAATEPAAAATEQPTPEELAEEEQYRKDWPEHAAREDRLKGKITKLETLLTTAVEALTTQIKPVADSVATTAQEKHLETIVKAHPDALTIADHVEEWIKTQPAFLQPTYSAVLDKGSAAEIVSLLDLYKTATGKPAVDTTGADKEKEAAEAAEKLKKDRLNRMESPKSVRTSVSAEDDPEDFDGAFEAEAKKIAVQ